MVDAYRPALSAFERGLRAGRGLGALAGATIFLGLPIARMHTLPKPVQGFLNAFATGILVFLLWDILTHAASPVEGALEAGSRAPAAAGIKPVATSASHPPAAAASVPNCAAINSAARRGTSAADGGVAPCTSGRTGGPTGTSGTPTPASRSAQSGGAHTRTSAPGARNRTASPTSGSTPPCESYVESNIRIPRPPFPACSGLGQRLCGTTRVLPQAPRCAIS